jgi:hypothetical protein
MVPEQSAARAADDASAAIRAAMKSRFMFVNSLGEARAADQRTLIPVDLGPGSRDPDSTH